MKDTCEWKPEDYDSDWYDSDCGRAFTFNYGGPVENGFVFCPKCGKPLKEMKHEVTGEEEK
jgi:hypothetical protein